MADINSSLPVKTLAAGDVSVKLETGQVNSGAFAAGSIASGAVASGAIASGAFASGAVSSGAVASGAFATGSIVAGAIAAGATSFVKLEDVASADADAGVPAMAILKATPADTAGSDGDYQMLQMKNGRLWVSALIDSVTGTIPVTFGRAVATGEVIDYSATSTTSLSTSNHDYTVTAGKTLLVDSVHGAASGKGKYDVIYDPTGANLTLATFFVSTAEPNYRYEFKQPFEAAATKVLRVVRTNNEASAMNMYSTINGIEV
jgi:hypothetical protein